ncbi:unnamed protein product [Clonostachys rhizophaga]|uniref:Uncharacterized protein n=1 Tax=Clonostachys rhizophaga TaxID=160324 RepID=A0A9N9YMA8_9HYPO|nr:unnamed protein product [Clonostachys rhizophaga]
MTAATVIAMPSIPGIQSPFTVGDMDMSNTTYNGLPRIHSDTSVSHDHVKKLETIIAQYNLREKLGIHLLHNHEDIPNGQINLETKLKTIPVQDGQAMESAAEVEVGKYGTIVLPKSMVDAAELAATRWPNTSQPYGPDAKPVPGTHWAKVKVRTEETHRVFVDQVENENQLLDKLVRPGVIEV